MDISRVQELLKEKADCQARIGLIPYSGSPEVKKQGDSKYLYMRKRVAGKLTSTYVDVYSDELYQLLLRSSKEERELRKRLRKIERELVDQNYEASELPQRVYSNIDFARANMKSNIYDQAVLEGVGTSFPQTEEIIDNGIVNGVKATDVQKILNLKHAWEFILDPDVLQSTSDYGMVCHIAKLVNEGFYYDGGKIRGVPVTIGGTKFVPPIPDEIDVTANIRKIVTESEDYVDIAIHLCLFCMRTQIFIDGNKRTAVIFANHFLIAHGQGFIVIPELEVPEFKKLLVKYYETDDRTVITAFLKEKCWKPF